MRLDLENHRSRRPLDSSVTIVTIEVGDLKCVRGFACYSHGFWFCDDKNKMTVTIHTRISKVGFLGLVNFRQEII